MHAFGCIHSPSKRKKEDDCVAKFPSIRSDRGGAFENPLFREIAEAAVTHWKSGIDRAKARAPPRPKMSVKKSGACAWRGSLRGKGGGVVMTRHGKEMFLRERKCSTTLYMAIMSQGERP